MGFKKMVALALVFSMSIQISAEEIRETVTNTADTGNILIGVEGYDYTDAMSDVLAKLNEVRLEACNEGVINPSTGQALKLSDYVPLKMGVNCTKNAKIRAAEASIYLSHARPTSGGNIGSCFDAANIIFANAGVNYQYIAENLGWTYETGTYVSGWIDEKDDYVNGNTGAVTGHYESIIDPSFKYVGFSTYNPVNDIVNYDWACTEATFAQNDTQLSTLEGTQNKKYIAKMEVPLSHVIGSQISCNSILQAGNTTKLLVKVDVDNKMSGSMHNRVYGCPVYDKVVWSSSNEDIVSVDGDVANAKSNGRVTLTATVGEGSDSFIIERDVLVVTNGTTVVGAVDPDTITVESYTKPILPGSVALKLSNNETINVDVEWEDYNVDLIKTNFKSNDFVVNGSAFGYAVKQRVHVNPANYLGYRFNNMAAGATIYVEYGEKPDYPTECFIGMSNGMEYVNIPITWDENSETCYKIRKGGEYIIYGTTPSYFATDDGYISFTVSVNVVVSPAPDYDPSEELNNTGDDSSGSEGNNESKVGNGNKLTDNVPVVGSLLKDKKYIYKITKSGSLDGTVLGEVEITGLNKKSLKIIKVAKEVKIGGVKYKITSIGNSAFKNNKNIAKVYVGNNVKKIGKYAFFGCKKLKRVVIKSKVLKKIGKKALYRKGGKKLIIKSPSGKKKKYKELLKKAKTNKYKVY